MKPWIASFGSSPTTAGAAAYIACTSRSLGGFAAAAATAPMPAARMTSGGSSVIATSSRLPSASRHSRTQTARTRVPRSGVRARASVVTSGHLARRPELGGLFGSALHDAQVDVFEMHLALDHVRDLRSAVDESAYQERIRQQRIGRGHDDRAVLEVRLTHALDALHAHEVLGAWPRQEADLGGAPVELGAQMIRRIDADHRLAEEGDAITQAVGLVEVMGAEEHRPALAA